MTENKVRDDVSVWWENEPLPENAQKIENAIKDLDDFDMAEAILIMMSHHENVMKIVRGRMNFELRDAVIHGVVERGIPIDEIDPIRIDRTVGKLLSDEAEEVMVEYWADELEEWTE